MVTKLVRSRLAELLKERRLQVTSFAKKIGVDPETISRLGRNPWHSITRDVLQKLLTALDCDVEDLFETVPLHLWYPIQKSGRVTVHLGSTPSIEAKGGEDGTSIRRLGVGTWDFRGFICVSEFLNRTCDEGVVFDYAEHTEKLHDPVRAAARLGSGCHVIFGSPLVNPMAEDAVCHGWKLPPRDQSAAKKLPYRFRWGRASESSLAEYAGRAEHGIVAQSGELVARHTVIGKGDDGEDCGLLCAYRYGSVSPGRPRRSRRTDGDDAPVVEDQVVIAIMGQSGCGTLAGAQLLCRDDVAQELYPEKVGGAVMRAFRVRYRRPLGTSRFDDREIVSAELVPTQ